MKSEVDSSIADEVPKIPDRAKAKIEVESESSCRVCACYVRSAEVSGRFRQRNPKRCRCQFGGPKPNRSSSASLHPHRRPAVPAPLHAGHREKELRAEPQGFQRYGGAGGCQCA